MFILVGSSGNVKRCLSSDQEDSKRVGQAPDVVILRTACSELANHQARVPFSAYMDNNEWGFVSAAETRKISHTSVGYTAQIRSRILTDSVRYLLMDTWTRHKRLSTYRLAYKAQPHRRHRFNSVIRSFFCHRTDGRISHACSVFFERKVCELRRS